MATAPAPAWVVGHTVHLRLSTGEEVQGQVFAVDEAHNMLATRSPGSHNGVERVRVINTGSVEDVLSNQAPATCSMELPTMFSQQFPAFLEQCRARERKALQQAEREASRVGAGVTQEAQGVFDALCKTLPCSWQGKTIVVLDEVHVSEPYTPEACTTVGAGNKATLERVRLILKAERKRLGLGD